MGSTGHSVDVETGGVLTVNITALNEDGQQLARWALEAWNHVTGIEFELVEDDNAFLTFATSSWRSCSAQASIRDISIEPIHWSSGSII